MSQNPPPNNIPNQSDTLTQILEKRTKIIEKMENLRSTLNTFLSKQFSVRNLSNPNYNSIYYIIHRKQSKLLTHLSKTKSKFLITPY